MKTFGSTQWPKNLKLSNPEIRKRKSPPRPQSRPGWGQNSLHFWREVQTRIQPSLLRPQVAATMFMFCLPIRIPRHKGMGYFFHYLWLVLTHNTWVIHTPFLPSKSNLYPKYYFWPKNDGENWSRNFILKSLHAGRWLCLLLNLWFWEFYEVRKNSFLHGGISK